ncbi:MAG TPA: hypothetical protein VET66_01645, partial [Steroidobacteraceae bacterium]|nr:hypothetical protein [Steroidobacteraceae bacterium]
AARAPARFAALVPALLADDLSWYTLPVIADYLPRRRPDLLTPCLDYRGYQGRWDTGARRILPALRQPFAGGTRRQQERVLNGALPLALDPNSDSRVAVQAVKLLALLPAIPPAWVTPLALHESSIVRTAALFALARLDTDGGLETLLEALGDTRARIAIHALRRFLVVMDPDRALAILRGAPFDRVTVAKEVMRLTAELAPNAAYDELLAYERRDLHRDTRIALLRALNAYLARPQTWDILERAAASPDPAVAQATLTLTDIAGASGLASRSAARTRNSVLRLLAGLLRRDDAETRGVALAYSARLGFADTERILTPLLFDLVETGIAPERTATQYEEARRALQTTVALCPAADATRIARLTRGLLPHRHLLQALCSALGGVSQPVERGLDQVARQMVAAMAGDPATLRLRIRLMRNALPVSQMIAGVAALARANELRLDVVMEWCAEIDAERTRLNDAELLPVEDAWRAHHDERLRRIALSYLWARARTNRMWAPGMLERLRAFRNDRSVIVASAAAFIFPFGDAPEEPPLV